jgi:hypothetical protein
MQNRRLSPTGGSPPRGIRQASRSANFSETLCVGRRLQGSLLNPAEYL